MILLLFQTILRFTKEQEFFEIRHIGRKIRRVIKRGEPFEGISGEFIQLIKCFFGKERMENSC